MKWHHTQVWVVLLVLVLMLSPVSGLSSLERFLNSLWSFGSSSSSTTSTSDSKNQQAPADRVKRQSRSSDPADSSSYHYETLATSLPTNSSDDINFRYMPTLSNGHIGVTVYSDALYVNGIYNGVGADSHRARIPPITMARVVMDEQLERNSHREFRFNVHEAVFTEEIETPFAYITHKTYVHQHFTRLLVTQIEATHKSSTDLGAKLDLEYIDVEGGTEDVEQTRHERDSTHYSNMEWQGRTREGEESGDQRDVYIYYKDPHRELVISDPVVRKTFYMAVDFDQPRAQSDLHKADEILRQTNGHDELFRLHTEAWSKVWARGRIEIEGDPTLAKITTFAQYYILSSLPNPRSEMFDFNEVYYGGSRTSLAKGGAGQDYNGHIFWDSEMYIMPAILMFQPDIAKYVLRYRAGKTSAAQSYAESSMQQDGYRFPWESAYSGSDVTPDTCITCREQQIFVTAAVNFAIRMYYSATRDPDFVNNPDYNPCDTTRETARFLQSLAVYNQETARYDINNVMGPDDWHPNVNNNAFTNVLVSLAIHWARYMACMCNRNSRSEVPDEWIEKALHLELPYDNYRRLHFQHDGFEEDSNITTIKQADTIMFAWPVHWNVSYDIVKNDLLYYEKMIDAGSPAMSWSFLHVGFKWVKENAKAQTYFEKSYTDYVRQPFKIWTEYNEGNEDDARHSSVNYLPGMGGFLQSIVYGYAGLRIRPDQLEFHNPTIPPTAQAIHLIGFKYIGVSMDIHIRQADIEIEVHGAVDDLTNSGPGMETYGEKILLLKQNDTYGREERLTPGAVVRVENPANGFYIIPEEPLTNCMHPWDHIYMPWGYSPWINAAPPGTHTPGPCLLLSIVLAYLLFVYHCNFYT